MHLFHIEKIRAKKCYTVKVLRSQINKKLHQNWPLSWARKGSIGPFHVDDDNKEAYPEYDVYFEEQEFLGNLPGIYSENKINVFCFIRNPELDDD